MYVILLYSIIINIKKIDSERRTQVTDDDSDYFNTNSVWLSSTEREKLQKYQQSLHDKKHSSRLNKKMTFDFAGK